MRYSHYGVISEISDLPGCGQIGISHYVWTPEDNRGAGNGSAAHIVRLNEIKKLGYDYAICTIESTNEKELKILANNGWLVLTSFVSRKTGHLVMIYGRDMKYPIKPFAGDIIKQSNEVYYEDYINKEKS